MKTTDPLCVLRFLNNQDAPFDIHFVPHSAQAAATIKRKGKAKKICRFEAICFEETSPMLVLGADPEKPSSFAVTP